MLVYALYALKCVAFFLMLITGNYDVAHRKLIKGINTHNVKQVEKALALGACLTSKDSNGRTPLAYACSKKSSRLIVELLLDYKANPNTYDHNKMTPLHYACLHGFKDVIETLLKYNADLDVVDNNNKKPLDYAIESYASLGDITIINTLLKHDFSPKNPYVFLFLGDGEDYQAIQEFEANEKKSDLIMMNYTTDLYQKFLLGHFVNQAYKNIGNTKQECFRLFAGVWHRKICRHLNIYENQKLNALKKEFLKTYKGIATWDYGLQSFDGLIGLIYQNGSLNYPEYLNLNAREIFTQCTFAELIDTEENFKLAVVTTQDNRIYKHFYYDAANLDNYLKSKIMNPLTNEKIIPPLYYYVFNHQTKKFKHYATVSYTTN